MATTRTRTANGSGPADGMTAVAKDAGEAVATTARRAPKPAVAAGAATAGLIGGLVIGTRAGARRHGLLARRPRVLGVPLGPKPGVLRAAEALRDSAKHLGRATGGVSRAGNELRATREQLEQLNRRSPVEVLLDGLTHRRGAHRKET